MSHTCPNVTPTKIRPATIFRLVSHHLLMKLLEFSKSSYFQERLAVWVCALEQPKKHGGGQEGRQNLLSLQPPEVTGQHEGGRRGRAFQAHRDNDRPQLRQIYLYSRWQNI